MPGIVRDFDAPWRCDPATTLQARYAVLLEEEVDAVAQAGDDIILVSQQPGQVDPQPIELDPVHREFARGRVEALG